MPAASGGPATVHLDPEQVFKAQTKDPLLLRVRQWVSDGKPPTKVELRGKSRDEQQYASRFVALGINDHGCLTITAKTLTGERTCYLLPSVLHQDAYFLAHGAPMAGHHGMEATIARVTMHFWWPTVHSDVHLMVQTCRRSPRNG